MPYVYLIGWSELKMFYYGVRYSKYADPSDLYVTYKTSSKYVKLFTEQHSEPDIVQVRKVFDNGDHESDKINAMSWESKVLRRMNAVSRSDFLNRWDNNMVSINLEGPFPFSDVKVQDKVDQTIRSKYNGRGSGSVEIKEKVFATNEIKYGTHHTLHLESVSESRNNAVMEKFGTDNPFKNPDKMAEIMKERYGVTNMMHDPAVKEKHKSIMAQKDWTARDEKAKKTRLEKYGSSDLLNIPETRERNKRCCPFGCRDNHTYNAGNFTNHMKKVHRWTKEQIKDFKDENKKD